MYCQVCNKRLRHSDTVTQLESADVLCDDCFNSFNGALDGEVAKRSVNFGRDIHDDWKR